MQNSMVLHFKQFYYPHFCNRQSHYKNDGDDDKDIDNITLNKYSNNINGSINNSLYNDSNNNNLYWR